MDKTILVVDDSESIREVVKFTLENNGYQVLLGSDGTDALDFFDGRGIDLIITDLHMPKMNGIEFIKEVRKKNDYTGILSTLAGLRTKVDEFFDQVLVMSEDAALRGNRIAILNRLSDYFLSTADISLLQQP